MREITIKNYINYVVSVNKNQKTAKGLKVNGIGLVFLDIYYIFFEFIDNYDSIFLKFINQFPNHREESFLFCCEQMYRDEKERIKIQKKYSGFKVKKYFKINRNVKDLEDILEVMKEEYNKEICVRRKLKPKEEIPSPLEYWYNRIKDNEKEQRIFHFMYYYSTLRYIDINLDFREERYKTHLIGIRRILKFILQRKKEIEEKKKETKRISTDELLKKFRERRKKRLKNPPQQTESLPDPFTTSLKWNAQKNIIGTLFGYLYDTGAITGTKKDLAQGLSTLFPNLSFHYLKDNINRKIKENESKVLYDIDTEIKIKPFLDYLKGKINKK